MNLFLYELAKEFDGRKIILIVDGAGWRKSMGLIVPSNIELVYLPPYSPELNPNLGLNGATNFVDLPCDHLKR